MIYKGFAKETEIKKLLKYTSVKTQNGKREKLVKVEGVQDLHEFRLEKVEEQ